MTSLTDEEKGKAIADALQGTCMTQEEGMQHAFPDEDPDDLRDNLAILAAIENEVFLCNTCGWWFELCDQADAEKDDGSERVEAECAECAEGD